MHNVSKLYNSQSFEIKSQIDLSASALASASVFEYKVVFYTV